MDYIIFLACHVVRSDVIFLLLKLILGAADEVHGVLKIHTLSLLTLNLQTQIVNQFADPF